MPVQYRPNSLRYPSADYSDPGVYYVTLCTQNRDPLFGEIVNCEMQCNALGTIVWNTWNHLPARFPGISIDTAIVMPDHFHGIVVIHDLPSPVGAANNRAPTVGAIHELPLQHTGIDLPLQHNKINVLPPINEFSFPTTRALRRLMTIPIIIGYLKMNSAKLINQIRQTPGAHVWQRGYYDKIFRVDKDYDSVVDYILSNPARWGTDKD